MVCVIVVALPLEVSRTLGGITDSMHSAVVSAVVLTTNVDLEVSFQIPLFFVKDLNFSLPPFSFGPILFKCMDHTL